MPWFIPLVSLPWLIPHGAPGSAKGTVEFLGFSFPDLDAAPSLWPPSCFRAGSSYAGRWERSRICGELICTDGYVGMDIWGWMSGNGCLRMDISGWVSRVGYLRLDISGWISWDGCLGMEISAWICQDGCLGMDMLGWVSQDGCLRMDMSGWMSWGGYVELGISGWMSQDGYVKVDVLGWICWDGYLGMHIDVSSFPSSPPSTLFPRRALPTRGRRKAPRAPPLPR